MLPAMFVLWHGGKQRKPMPPLSAFSLTEVALIVLSVAVVFTVTWRVFYLVIHYTL
jgi:hypothetical protein